MNSSGAGDGEDMVRRPSSMRDMEKSESNTPSRDPDTPAEKDTAQAPEVAPAPGPEPPPNGGYGWVCTICCGTINAHTWGLNSSYGVFLAHYLATDTFPGASSLEYAFVGSLSISCAMLVSPFATMTTRLYGTRATLFIGIVFETASLLGASWAREIWQLFLSQGVSKLEDEHTCIAASNAMLLANEA